jgi:ATP-dependent Clp protease ATP-binding subunit ClpA
MDASNLLKPSLAGGNLRCVGSTTYKEYRQHFEKDRALVRRFQKIDVKEPTVEDAIEILKGLKSVFEDYHRIRYTNEAIKALAQLVKDKDYAKHPAATAGRLLLEGLQAAGERP